MKAIGIDIGTTSICGLCIDTQTGDTLQTITTPNDTFIPTPNSWEKIQHPDRIFDKAIDILDQLIAEDVVSIGVSGQMHGILYLNQNGNPVSPLYTWQDMRGNLPYQKATYADCIGCAPGYGHATHFYNRINNLVPSDMRCFCSIGDYFAMKLCHRKAPLIHSSNAASFGLFDITKNRFNGDFYGEVTKDCAIIGEYKNIPVSVAFGDNQASFMGAGGAEDRVLVNVGTGSQVSVIASDYADYTGSLLELRPYVRDKYLLVGSALCGGRAYALLKDFFDDIHFMLTGTKHPDIYACMEQELLGKGDGSLATDLVFNTQFAGSRQNPMLRGSIHQMGLEHFNARDFMVGLLHGMAEELYAMYKDSPLTAKQLIASGNGIRKNKALQKILGNVFQLEPNIPVCKEEAAYGAALLSLLSVQYFQCLAQVSPLIRYDQSSV